MVNTPVVTAATDRPAPERRRMRLEKDEENSLTVVGGVR